MQRGPAPDQARAVVVEDSRPRPKPRVRSESSLASLLQTLHEIARSVILGAPAVWCLIQVNLRRPDTVPSQYLLHLIHVKPHTLESSDS